MSEEYEVLSQLAYPYAGLFPGYESGANVLKKLVGHFVGDFSIVTDVMIGDLVSSGFFKTLEEKAEVKQGDIQHIVGKFAKLKEITLTNKNILLLYQKGWFSKKNKLIVIPLEYATDVNITEGQKRFVTTKERRIGLEWDSVYISFQLTGKEKDVINCFNLALSVDKPWIWTKAIERILGLDSSQVKEKICRTINTAIKGRRLPQVVCITQKRLVITRFLNRSLLKRMIALIALMMPGYFILFIALFALVLAGSGLLLYGWTMPRLLADMSYLAFFISGILLTFVPFFVAIFLKRRRYRNLAESEPQNILDTESTSFEIPYSEITHVKINKKRFGRVQKVEVATKNGIEIFKIAKRYELLSFIQLIQRFLPESKIIMEFGPQLLSEY